MECDGPEHKTEHIDKQKVDFLINLGYRCEKKRKDCYCVHNSFVPSSKAEVGVPHNLESLTARIFL